MIHRTEHHDQNHYFQFAFVASDFCRGQEVITSDLDIHFPISITSLHMIPSLGIIPVTGNILGIPFDWLEHNTWTMLSQ